MKFKPFDVSAQELVWDGPAAWLDRLCIGPPGRVDLIDFDIIALTAAADKVYPRRWARAVPGEPGLQLSHQPDLVRDPLVPPGGPLSSTPAARTHRPGPAAQ